MTIKDYLEQHRTTLVVELKELTDLLKDILDGEMTKEVFINLVTQLAADSADIYNHGFNQCMNLIGEADVAFLGRKLPPHLR